MTTCSTCKFYVLFEDGMDGGQCRALPPVISVEVARSLRAADGYYDPLTGYWPTVYDDLGCGHHQEKVREEQQAGPSEHDSGIEEDTRFTQKGFLDYPGRPLSDLHSA